MSAFRILNVRIDPVTIDEACAHAESALASGGVHRFATVNPEFVATARRDPEFAQVLESSALNLPDGVGITLAARLRGRPLPERVTGVELTQRLCARAAARGWRVFFLGAAEGVAARAGLLLQVRHPGLIIAGAHAGSPRAEDAADITARVRAAQPHLLFVAYGAPAQDLWLARHLDACVTKPAPQHGLIGMGVGGTFDYLAGVRPFAPAWVRRAGFEWLYRLIRQPQRWRRQLDLLRFAWWVLREGR